MALLPSSQSEKSAALAERLRQLSPEQRALVERRLSESANRASPAPALERRPDPGDSPLSFAQDRFWFLRHLEPEAAVYNRPAFFRLTGPLDARILEQALNEIVRRHEVLRATFPGVEGRPTQIIRPWEPQPLPLLDLSAQAAEDRDAALHRLALATVHEPFDLARGPVMRATLVRCAPEDHVLLLVFHHIVFDAWSGTVLLNELSQLYEAFHRPAPSPLPELPIQYVDFAAWQRRCLAAGVWEDHLGFWKRELAGELPALELPIAKPRPPASRYRGGAVSMELPLRLAADLNAR
jgi:hypothetical protein